MGVEDVAVLQGKLDTLEQVMKEKWSSHDKHATERWTDLMDKLHEIDRKHDSRPCKDHIQLMSSLSEKVIKHEKEIDGIITKLWAVVLCVLAAIVTSVMSLINRQ